MIVIVIGVAGSGKTTLGRALAQALDWEFVEGDDFHLPRNVEKMRRGEPLNDADRAPWLAELHGYIAALDRQGRDAVVACSALKQRYREILSAAIRDVRFVYLCGAVALIRARLQSRKAHFMRAELLDSQIATLEPPERAVRVDIDMPTDQQVAAVLRGLGLEAGQ
ncbi:MAG: gluconokinase [Gammaproteobacteria bacterium]|jgi:gluconokinase